ncbi:3'(2'),5'-bisphosphate nucleotidase CysQ [Balneolaceae bacterium YR4-1]|uniref:3'(2'),5'-bisphosphate nucleotidase CysQ n=1 Tax=Halalkalibaculum roseum TaxID=2709311 RepID=A0A6M1SSZ9_9BACT|nr:3'(2'),5'-bisphosphate nucleotidase CysQ [Halalkalibaculum roseum]NGP75912.1 3'(2'),5'-bisphosphate nucleotidase CysQ [Halalkalibaculum roseum]
MIEKIIKTARQAGEAILEFYSEDIEVYDKEDDSPLTKADLAAHHIILDALAEIDPDTPVISEESGVPEYDERKHWKKFWIVDPLDGTKEFIKKNGEFTVNIALIEDGKPVLGVVYLPAKDVMYFGEKNLGSYKSEQQKEAVRIYSKAADISKPVTVIQSRSHGSDTLKDDLAEKGIKMKDSVKAGSSLKFCLVAEGKADIYPRMGPTMEWDVAAGDCVYRNSAQNGEHYSPLTYNKPDLKNSGFLIGLNENVEF